MMLRSLSVDPEVAYRFPGTEAGFDSFRREISRVESRILYRIVRERHPKPRDFSSHKQLGRPLRNPRRERDWADGISAYDSLAYAIAQARALKLRAGRFVVPLRMPSDGSIEYLQTGVDVHHFTINLTGVDAVALIAGPAIALEDLP